MFLCMYINRSYKLIWTYGTNSKEVLIYIKTICGKFWINKYINFHLKIKQLCTYIHFPNLCNWNLRRTASRAAVGDRFRNVFYLPTSLQKRWVYL